MGWSISEHNSTMLIHFAKLINRLYNAYFQLYDTYGVFFFIE